MSTFVTVKSADLKGAALDWAVALAERQNVVLAAPAYGNGWRVRYDRAHAQGKYSPSTDWSQGGPLIDKYSADVDGDGEYREAWIWQEDSTKYCKAWADTTLIAVCRVVVISVLGETVPVPEELT